MRSFTRLSAAVRSAIFPTGRFPETSSKCAFSRLVPHPTEPTGSHGVSWRVSDPEVKRAIRVAAEEEERAFYGGRAPEEWLEALAPLGTDEAKPFLERAPYLIVVFGESYAVEKSGEKSKNYYVTESVGIATGDAHHRHSPSRSRSP